MKEITRNTKLQEALERYQKDGLLDYAYELGLTGVSKLKKAELAERIAEQMLEPEELFYRMAILDNQSIAIFEKALKGTYHYDDKTMDRVFAIKEMHLGWASKGEFWVFPDVAKAWEKVKGEEFSRYQKRASWVWKCVYWCEKMYAFTPMDIFLEVINSKKGMRMKTDETIEMFYHFPIDRLWSGMMDDEFLVNRVYAADEERGEALLEQQADKEFYIPSSQEVEEHYDELALLSTPAYQKLKKFMENCLCKDKIDTEGLLLDLWVKISWLDEGQDAIQWFLQQFDSLREDELQEVMGLLMEAHNNTRMLANRGNTPIELAKKSTFQGMPTITAGSAQAAALLREVAPDIEKMGFDLDIDANADTIPVIGMPNGMNGGIVRTEKKVYPNDPCPCGSGKKYKKCCGHRI